MTNHLRIADTADADLIAWMDRVASGNGFNKLRSKTARLYVAVLRAMDRTGPPMTVRQIYYALVSAGAIPKTEGAYNKAQYHVLQMRRRGVLPYRFVADNTRWMRKPDSYDSIHSFLEISRKAYRRALWQDQDAYIEIWCEKDALAGVISDVTEEWDVALMVTRGYPSESFLYEAAENLKRKERPAYVYYFGDHDPSGVNIPKTTHERLRDFGATFNFEQVAVQPWQVEAWGLPTRPTKRSDSRAKNWQGGSVELDAIPADQLRQLVRQVIEQHVNPYALEQTRQIEKLERESLEQVIENLGLAPD